MLPRHRHRRVLRRPAHVHPGWVSRAVAVAVAVLAGVSTSLGTAALAEPEDLPQRSNLALQTTPRVLPATEEMLQPYRGSGTWVDVYDWSKRYGGAKFGVADIDRVAAAGYQTVYIQTTKAKIADAVLEPARLKSIIRRAHERGLSVVGWYLPSHDNEWRDYRKTIAMLRLGVDGIGLDLESTVVKDVPTRSAAAVRLMRRVADKVTSTDRPLALASITYTPFTLDASQRLWPDFPWRELADYTHVWMPMSYWSQQLGRGNGMDNATTFTNDSITRLRERLGDDARIHMIGGSGTSAYQVQRMVDAVRAAGPGVIGASLYDWRTTVAAAHPRMSALRALRAPTLAPASDVVASANIVAFRTSGGNVQVRRLGEDGSWRQQQDILGQSTATPSIAVDRRPAEDAWFVVVPTAHGFGWAHGTARTIAPRLKASWRAPEGCVPSTSRWSHTGFVVFCRTPAAVKFAVYSPGPRTWSRWLDVPVPNAAHVTSITAAALGSQIVLAWTTSASDGATGGDVSVALWDPAIRRSLTAVPLVDDSASPVQSTTQLRLNGFIDDGRDTAAGLWLTTRTATASRATWLSRDALLQANITAAAPRADASTVRPIAEVFFDVSSHRVIKRGTKDVWLGALTNRTPPAP